MYYAPHSLCFSSIRKKITFNENALLRDRRKMDLFYKINTTALILKISLPNLQGTPGIGQI